MQFSRRATAPAKKTSVQDVQCTALRSSLFFSDSVQICKRRHECYSTWIQVMNVMQGYGEATSQLDALHLAS